MNHESADDWRPTASHDRLAERAALLAKIRSFFAARGVLEVETPLLSSASVTDLHLHSFRCRYQGPGAAAGRTLYLQTSPEFAMKRLLAAGSGPIYQICKAFRNQEGGRLHNPEFTLLEWYRPGFDHHDLMDEMDALLREVAGQAPAERLSYAEAFQQQLGVDPQTAPGEALESCARDHGLQPVGGLPPEDRDGWLHFLMSHAVQPQLRRDRPVFIYDYPPSQAALARVREGSPAVAERFEVYVQGIELANGFHELTDAVEQRRRFEADLASRRKLGLEAVPVDERFLDALSAGLPDCSGVALGLDRLVMLATGAETLAEVLSFPVDRS